LPNDDEGVVRRLLTNLWIEKTVAGNDSFEKASNVDIDDRSVANVGTINVNRGKGIGSTTTNVAKSPTDTDDRRCSKVVIAASTNVDIDAKSVSNFEDKSVGLLDENVNHDDDFSKSRGAICHFLFSDARRQQQIRNFTTQYLPFIVNIFGLRADSEAVAKGL
jgi:hypothetical protein